MDNRILNEVKRNRELMGINESELDEQGFLRGVRDGIKKGFEKGKEFVKDKVIDPIKDKLDGEEEVEVEKYNNKPISDIIQNIEDMGKLYGKIDVNGETLYFGKGESMDREIAEKKATRNVEMAIVPTEDIETTNFSDEEGNNVERTVVDTEIKGGYGEIVIRELTQKTDGNYVYYILRKK
jgi:uncharacterized protein YjgD (DUF1641 family)